MSILELQDVSHRAGEKLILQQATWSVQPGEHWAILGANGSGKTTLLKIASGFLWPNAGGVVKRLGKELIDLRELRKSIGWVTLDMPGQIPSEEPVCDTVVSGRFGRLGSRRSLFPEDLQPHLFEEAHAQLAALGADSLAQQPFGTLSQGERQKVLIARARMAKPLVIFLDEPCGGLDPGARERLLESLEQLAQQTDDVSLVLVTHHVEEITPSFANTLVMAGGRTIASGRTADLLTDELLTKLYGVEVHETIRHEGRVWPIFG